MIKKSLAIFCLQTVLIVLLQRLNNERSRQQFFDNICWPMLLTKTFDNCFWRLFLTLFFDDCFLYLFLTIAFDKSFFTIVFKNCFWLLFLPTVCCDYHLKTTIIDNSFLMTFKNLFLLHYLPTPFDNSFCQLPWTIFLAAIFNIHYWQAFLTFLTTIWNVSFWQLFCFSFWLSFSTTVFNYIFFRKFCSIFDQSFDDRICWPVLSPGFVYWLWQPVLTTAFHFRQFFRIMFIAFLTTVLMTNFDNWFWRPL